MKRKLLILLTTLMCICTALGALTACSPTSTPEKPKSDIVGISFVDASFDYDNSEKSLLISGTLPDGVTVQYTNNKGTNAGVYNATAFLSGENYNDLTLTAKLTINKIEITNVSVEPSQKIVFDDKYHLPQINGTLPSGVSAKYFFNDVEKNGGVKAIDTYQVKIILSGENYIEKTFDCTFKIAMDYKDLAASVMNAFGNVPDPWSFLPQSFAPQHHTISSTIDYSNFVQVSSIPKNGIGKQLNVVYGLLNKTSKALSYITPVYATLNTIKTIYTEYLDNNPENYKTFTNTVSGITFTLSITETQYLISAKVKNINVEIFADTETNSFGAKVQLTETTALKYIVTENTLCVAMNVLNTVSTYVEFARNEDVVVGMVYEYLYADDKQITATSAMITVDKNYTTLIGTKGDFIPTSISRNCEVYRNSDGTLVGTEVREELEIGFFTDVYNTLWYNLSSLSGISSIKKVDKENLPNPDTIYINNYTADNIHTKLVGTESLKKSASRRFDIEFKKMYFYQYNETNQEYEEISMEIPMMFIQEEVLNSFTTDFKNANPNSVSITVNLNVNSSDKSAVATGYYTLLVEYDKLKDSVSQQDIISFCKN